MILEVTLLLLGEAGGSKVPESELPLPCPLPPPLTFLPDPSIDAVLPRETWPRGARMGLLTGKILGLTDEVVATSWSVPFGCVCCTPAAARLFTRAFRVSIAVARWLCSWLRECRDVRIWASSEAVSCGDSVGVDIVSDQVTPISFAVNRDNRV